MQPPLRERIGGCDNSQPPFGCTVQPALLWPLTPPTAQSRSTTKAIVHVWASKERGRCRLSDVSPSPSRRRSHLQAQEQEWSGEGPAEPPSLGGFFGGFFAGSGAQGGPEFAPQQHAVLQEDESLASRG